VDTVKFATELGMHPNMSTNGHLITEQILNQLYEVGMTHDLSVSMDGPSQQVNDGIRGRGAFFKTLKGMYTLNRFEKILWGVNYVSCGLNLGHALETARMAKRIGASYFNLIRVTPFGRTAFFKSSLVLTEEQYMSEVSKVSSHFRSFGNFFDDIMLYDLTGDLKDRAVSYFDNPSFDSLPCGISINHKGEVSLSPPRIDLGNCLETDIEALLRTINSDSVQDLYCQWLRNERQGIHQPPRSKVLAAVIPQS
jgi:MoaA/NifB/PqqE/SkfB family radical SAM enzyme